jgi:Spy/CpxP family protein refolding chaperone
MLIFGTGVVTGALVVRHAQIRSPRIQRPQPQPNARPNLPISPSAMRLEFLRRAVQELNLSPEQHERLDRIVKESQQHMRKLMEPIAPQMNESFQKTREQFRAVLTPEQRARFDEMSRQQQRAHEPRRPNPPRDHSAESPAPPPPANP